MALLDNVIARSCAITGGSQQTSSKSWPYDRKSPQDPFLSDNCVIILSVVSIIPVILSSSSITEENGAGLFVIHHG
ncbi:hypothetical protein LN650_00040 [Klebsiella pneumoniae subsp. pneumoniae]|nr:hypothetical protein [Klebsiella pneumoniae subsp. pneumoniae]